MGTAQSMGRLFDLYGERWSQRLVVFSLMAIGMWFLVTGRLQGALPIAFLVWVNRVRLSTSMAERFRRHPVLVFLPACVVMALRIASPLPAAHDDLLRHIASAFWPGGYREMYLFASLPAFDAYLSFERLVHFLAHQMGELHTMWLIQALAWAGFVLVFVAAAHRVLPMGEDRAYWVLGALLLVVSAVSIRLTLARPEIFMTIWALAASLVLSRRAGVIWAICGVVVSTGYWLAPIYYPAVVLLPFGWRVRLLVLAALVVVWYAIWFSIIGGDPISPLLGLGDMLSSRMITVGENASVVNLVALPGFVILAGAAVWAIGRPQRDIRFLLLAGYFLLSDQVRYVSTAAPLLALFALSAVRTTALPWPPSARFGAVAASILLAPATVASIPRLHELPAFGLPRNSVVLSGFTPALYAIPFYNPGTVRVAPVFEIGAAEPWVQEAAAEIQRGSISCDAVARGGFTHVVEKSLRGTPPPCLELAAADRGWRLWRVRPEE